MTVIRKIANAVIPSSRSLDADDVESVRQLGTSILASAGIASLIVGFAAQRSIATLPGSLPRVRAELQRVAAPQYR